MFASGAAAALLAMTGGAVAGRPRRGGQLRLALSGARRDDSWLSGNGLFMQVARLGMVFDALTEVAADGTLRGELATGWQSDETAQEWQFDLRDDVTFHDGTRLSADDVLSSLSGAFNVQAVNSHRISIRLQHPDPNLPFTLADAAYVIRPAYAQNAGIGTGLYRAVHFAAGQQLIAELVANHYKGDVAGWFDRVELVSVPASGARVQAVQEYLVDGADLADVTQSPRGADIHVLRGMHVVGSHIGMPARIGHTLQFDDLRAPERWWHS